MESPTAQPQERYWGEGLCPTGCRGSARVLDKGPWHFLIPPCRGGRRQRGLWAQPGRPGRGLAPGLARFVDV